MHSYYTYIRAIPIVTKLHTKITWMHPLLLIAENAWIRNIYTPVQGCAKIATSHVTNGNFTGQLLQSLHVIDNNRWNYITH